MELLRELILVTGMKGKGTKSTILSTKINSFMEILSDIFMSESFYPQAFNGREIMNDQ